MALIFCPSRKVSRRKEGVVARKAISVGIGGRYRPLYFQESFHGFAGRGKDPANTRLRERIESALRDRATESNVVLTADDVNHPVSLITFTTRLDRGTPVVL
jgi:hypothetical protein